MSSNRKNNHYHYAEKFEHKRTRSRSGRSVFIPFKSVIASLIVLLMFGLVSTTFGAYMTENEPEYDPEKPGIISEVRNIKATRDVAVTGSRADLAETGGTFSFSGTSYMYFDNTLTNWSDTYIYLVIGKSSWSALYRMSKVTNTNYYVVQMPSSWDSATYMAVIGNASSWGDGNWGSSNLTNANHRTAAYTAGITTSNNQRYTFTPGSSSNGCTLSLAYKGTDNSSMDTVSLKAHACYSTTGASNSYTADNSTGGTVKISSYYFSAYNTVATSNTGNGAASASYDAAKTTSAKTSTFTATAASSYVFKGWYSAANGGTLVSSDATYSYSTNGGDKEVYARFLKQYYLTVAKSPSTYTGTPTASPVSSSSNKKDANTEITLSADVKNGVTFGGWSFKYTSGGASYTPTYSSGYSASSNPTKIKLLADITATASYTLGQPTINSFTYSSGGVMTEGTTLASTTALTPTVTATSAADDPSGTFSYAYSVASSPAGTTSGTHYSLDTTTGAFKAIVAGTYKIRVTVTDSSYGLSSSRSTASTAGTYAPADVTITVRPPAPDISALSYTVDGWTSEYSHGTTGRSHTLPIKVPIRSTTYKIVAWLTSTNANYTYRWANTAGTYDSNGVVTLDTPAVTHTESGSRSEDLCTASGTALKVSADGNNAYVLNVYATRNNVDSVPLSVTLYYDVISDFLDIEWMSFTENSNDYQKIYAEDNGITQLRSSIRAGGTTFNTFTWASSDNIVYQNLEIWSAGPFPLTSSNVFGTFTFQSPKPNDNSHLTADKQETFNVAAVMQYLGTKWIRIYINDTGSGKTAAAPRTIHTTVGTSSTVANRPIYYIDTTNNTLSNSNNPYRVMAFYMRSSDETPTVRYQTGEIVSSRTNESTGVYTYRFYIPADATKITFAHVAKNNYVLPSISNGNLSYSVYTDHTILMAWTSPIDLTSENNIGKTTFIADTAGTADSNGIYNYSNTANSGNMTTLPAG